MACPTYVLRRTPLSILGVFLVTTFFVVFFFFFFTSDCCCCCCCCCCLSTCSRRIHIPPFISLHSTTPSHHHGQRPAVALLNLHGAAAATGLARRWLHAAAPARKLVTFDLADIGEAIAEVELVQWYGQNQQQQQQQKKKTKKKKKKERKKEGVERRRGEQPTN